MNEREIRIERVRKMIILRSRQLGKTEMVTRAMRAYLNHQMRQAKEGKT